MCVCEGRDAYLSVSFTRVTVGDGGRPAGMNWFRSPPTTYKWGVALKLMVERMMTITKTSSL